MEEKKSNKTLTWILGILVGVLLIAVIVLAVNAFAQDEEPPVAEVPEEIPPTELPPSGPTPTPIPGDPEQELGRPDGRDDFSTENNWTLFDSDCFKSEIVDQQYVMTAKGVAGYSCWEVSWPSVQDYYLQTNLIMPDTCIADDRFGLFIRTPDLKQGYLVGLTCDGRLVMTRWDGEETHVMVNFVSDPIVNTEPGSVNRLGVIANEANYALYVNGKLLGEATDASFVDEMRFGYFVRAASEEPFVVKFDDMAIWLIEEE